MWSTDGAVFDRASKRSMTGRTDGREVEGERRRGVDSEISGVCISHLEGVIFFERRAVT